MPRVDGRLLEIHAREKAGMGETWNLYHYEHVTLGGKHVGYELKGAVAPPKLSGKSKGQPNWAKRDMATDRTVGISVADHDAWVDQWEARTGLCRECMGDGKTVASFSVSDGPTYRECGSCQGTGKAKGGDETC